MRIFGECSLREFLDSQRQEIKQEVHGQNDNYILNVGEDQYVEYLTAKFRLDPLTLLWDGVSVSDREDMIPGELFPSFRFNVSAGRSYPKQVVTYHLPYLGNEQLLRCIPSSRILWSTEVMLKDSCICFDIINFVETPDDIRREADDTLKRIRTQACNVETEVEQFNNTIESEIRQTFQSRKASLLKKSDVLGSLGVPLKKANAPSTFSVPVAHKRVIVQKPNATTAPFKPEPTLAEATYQEILKIIWDAGVEMERHPSIYRGKDEETLRDHLLMVLAPHFDSTTGETFNKQGKTDILIRHAKQNLFVAECKFWGGIKEFHKAIDQLLGYLTWRDSKASLVCFVRNKEIAPVLQTIQEQLPNHVCFVKPAGEKQDGWFQFEFHLPGDSNRQVKVAVQVFHFP